MTNKRVLNKTESAGLNVLIIYKYYESYDIYSLNNYESKYALIIKCPKRVKLLVGLFFDTKIFIESEIIYCIYYSYLITLFTLAIIIYIFMYEIK